ncbi:hypothetical protein SLEP1_g34194 [Rubroshorea leprosula]|uniref:Uncharacterized protein n=1 Tax=Rubroshorea leprosula TaxID=152421 RepID=A0AAV5KJ15_9ROSI|nr:hypothetical protein SLEP1_g34194 [Rubroshorea leprosula]
MKLSAKGGMKKASMSITGGRSSYEAGPKVETHAAVDLPPPPPSIVLASAIPGRGNSGRFSSSVNTKTNVICITSGSCSKAGEKRKISRLQEAKENLKRMKAEVKRMKAEVKKKSAETNLMMLQLMEETTKFQAAAEGIESALAQGRAQNEQMMVQNLQDQCLLMLGWRYILDEDDNPTY